MANLITLADIQQAQERIKGIVTRTPLIRCPGHPSDCELYFKPETLQPVGAFKLRGAYNKIASLTDAERAQGIIAFSSGNHAQGVAYAARVLGVKATIVMPAIAPEIKVQKTKAYGAQVVLLHDGSEEEWRIAAEELAAKHGYVMVPPFNDKTIIAGQGTAGLEILEDLPDVETIYVPIGGGGLASGVGAAIKLSGSTARVIGVEPEFAADARSSFYAGHIVEFTLEQTRRTIADGMRAPRLGDITFAHIRAYVDDIVTVSEEEIVEAMRRLLFNARLLAEPSGAVTFAAHLFRSAELPPSRRSVAVISGGNIAPELLAEIL